MFEKEIRGEISPLSIVEGKNNSSGARFTEERERVGVTQADVAVRVGVDRKTIGNFERGVSAINSTFLSYVADEFGVDVNYVLTGRRSAVASLDASLLKGCLDGLEEALMQQKKTMTATRKAEIVVALYELYRTTGSAPQRATVLQLVKHAA